MASETAQTLSGALLVHVERVAPSRRWRGTEVCEDMNVALEVLHALCLDWAYYPTYRTVHVMPRLDAAWYGPVRDVETCQATDATPAALATALVQAALALLDKEGDASCPD